MKDYTPREHIAVYEIPYQNLERYTVLYLNTGMSTRGRVKLFDARSMSVNPNHPLGFNQLCTAMRGRHLGRRIAFQDLPPECQKVVKVDLRYYNGTAKTLKNLSPERQKLENTGL